MHQHNSIISVDSLQNFPKSVIFLTYTFLTKPVKLYGRPTFQLEEFEILAAYPNKQKWVLTHSEKDDDQAIRNSGITVVFAGMLTNTFSKEYVHLEQVICDNSVREELDEWKIEILLYHVTRYRHNQLIHF